MNIDIRTLEDKVQSIIDTRKRDNRISTIIVSALVLGYLATILSFLIH